MNKQDFLTKGYKEHPCPRHESDWCETFLQKRIVDDSGTRYFIDVYISREYIPGTKIFNRKPIAKVQLELTTATTNIELFHFESVDEMELFFARMFIATDAYYYERY